MARQKSSPGARWFGLAAVLLMGAACVDDSPDDADDTAYGVDELHELAQGWCQQRATCGGDGDASICVAGFDEAILTASDNGCLDTVHARIECDMTNYQCLDGGIGVAADKSICRAEEELAEDCQAGRL